VAQDSDARVIRGVFGRRARRLSFVVGI